MKVSKEYIQKHRKKRRRKKPLKRTIKVWGKEIEVCADLIHGEWMAWFDYISFIRGRGDSLAEALENLKTNLEELYLHIEKDIKEKIPLALYLVDIYDFFKEE